jgi:transposase InsO family protein
MSKTMPNSTQEEKYRWIKPILDGEISIKNMSLVCPFSLRALKYWLANYQQYGLAGLENKSRKPKSNPHDTPIRIKERVIELRRESKLCAKKLKWKLDKEGIYLNPRTIHKFIQREGLVRKYRTRKIKPLKKKSFIPGELVEIDIKYVPKRLKNGRYYQFTAIDSATRWRYLKIYDEMSNYHAIDFLRELITLAPFKIQAIKTDNGCYFTNRYTGYLKSSDILNPRLHPLDLECAKIGIAHYLIDPGKPQQNAYVERSHRTDQEMFYERIKFYTIQELKRKIKLWNMEYNNLEHCGLNGLSPNEALGIKVQNVRS